jgi:hypothetical protein
MRAPIHERAGWIKNHQPVRFAPPMPRQPGEFQRRFQWCEDQLGPEMDRWVSYAADLFVRDARDATLYRLAFGDVVVVEKT